MGYLPGNISYACLDLQTFELSKIGLIWAVTNVLVYWAVIILPSEILRSHEFRIQSSTHYFIDSRHFRWTVWFADCFSAFSGGEKPPRAPGHQDGCKVLWCVVLKWIPPQVDLVVREKWVEGNTQVWGFFMKTSYETGRGNLAPKWCDWSKFGGEEFKIL